MTLCSFFRIVKMTKKYKNKYRIESIRLRYWNYGWNAAYFVTIYTKNRHYYFGNVKNGKMVLTEIGQIAQDFWEAIPEHFPFVQLGEYVIMPNHVHGIIIINKPVDTVETHVHASPPPQPQPDKPVNQFGPQSGNLASIIRGYKSAVKKHVTLHGIDFAWQPRYYDHIIRDEKSFYQISKYIKNNPINWKDDIHF